MRPGLRWAPVAILGLGVVGILTTGSHRALSLRAPLSETVPADIGSFTARDVTISEQEAEVAGFTDYLMRVYEGDTGEGAPGDGPAFSVYVGYYDSQMQGRTIHSPRNCLPGGGWEPLTSSIVHLTSGGSQVPVNRYVLGKDGSRALVLYWYQGRGRVAANEYAVKWHLLRDAALHGRSDEALVRIVVPITESEDAAFELASDAALRVLPAVDQSLPG